MPDYIVTRPIRGTQTLLVRDVANKAEAKRAVNTNSESAEGIDFSVHYYGAAKNVTEEKSG